MSNEQKPVKGMMGGMGGHGRRMAGEKAKDFKGTVKKLAVYRENIRLPCCWW